MADRAHLENLMRQLTALKDAVTENTLTDSGRHFTDGNYCDLTRCHHGDTGEYANPADGKAVALLWNLWKSGAFETLPTPASSPQPYAYITNDPAWVEVLSYGDRWANPEAFHSYCRHRGWEPLYRGAPSPSSHVSATVRDGISKAWIAMKLAAALPGVAKEYDFTDAIAAIQGAWLEVKDGNQPPQTHVVVEDEIARVVQSVNEWDDRTSPDDYPEHLLITSEELIEILRNFADTLGGRNNG